MLVLLLVAGAGGFFYLIREANTGGPAPQPAEVEVDVNLER
jgi:hypothetical protein